MDSFHESMDGAGRRDALVDASKQVSELDSIGLCISH